MRVHALEWNNGHRYKTKFLDVCHLNMIKVMHFRNRECDERGVLHVVLWGVSKRGQK